MQRSVLHLELDLPLTSIQPIEDSVDPPTFISPICKADHRSNEITHFKKHSEAQLELHHVCTNLCNGTNDSIPLFSYSFEFGPQIHYFKSTRKLTKSFQ